MTPRKVAIIGTGQSRFRSRRDDATYAELVREGVRLALDDAGIGIERVGAVVYALAPDALIGVSNAERWGAEAVGIDKPMMRLNTGGSTGITAVQAGYYHVASGLFDAVLVAGADKVGECGNAQAVLNKIWDPIYERGLPLNAINMLSLSGVRYMAKYGMTEEHMALVTVKNRRNAARNPHAHLREEVTVQQVLDSPPLCWPIKRLDACPQSSGGAAVVLASEALARELCARPAWVRGVGNCAESYFMGDRMGPKAPQDHADATALARSFQAAYRMAGITRPAEQIDAAELYAPFSNTEFHAIDASGVCAPGESLRLMEQGHFALEGRFPVNPSGGTQCTNPIAVTAMVRAIEAALQVMHKAGEHQVPGVNTAIASGNGGDHQFFGTMVLSSDPG